VSNPMTRKKLIEVVLSMDFGAVRVNYGLIELIDKGGIPS
jgi:hypothetical protein